MEQIGFVGKKQRKGIKYCENIFSILNNSPMFLLFQLYNGYIGNYCMRRDRWSSSSPRGSDKVSCSLTEMGECLLYDMDVQSPTPTRNSLILSPPDAAPQASRYHILQGLFGGDNNLKNVLNPDAFPQLTHADPKQKLFSHVWEFRVIRAAMLEGLVDSVLSK